MSVRRRWAIVGVLAVIATVSVATAQRGPLQPPRATTYQVRPGDTLWRLATRVEAPHADRREVIWLLQEINGLSRATLYPGQVLLLPADAASFRVARRAPRAFAARVRAARSEPSP